MTSTLTNEQWLTDWHDWHASREKAILAPHGVAANTGTTWLSDDPQVIDGLPGEWVVRAGRAVDARHNLALAPGGEYHSGVSTEQFRFLKFAASDSAGVGDSAGVVELDFNRAFLPPCAFGAGYLCPIPPAQNRLPFAVEAGERSPLSWDQPW